MVSSEQLFRDFLRHRRLKFTGERAATLQAVARFDRPFQAEELLAVLRQGGYGVSKATMYRTLKHLLEAGLVKQIQFGEKAVTLYDFVYGELGGVAHDHLLDLDTGKIIPFSDEVVVRLRDQIARKMGYTALSHRFQITARRG